MDQHRHRAGDRLRHRPATYKEKAAVSALQWAVGLELFLLSADPWRVVLSTDHPNGGSFLSYPALIQLLMDRTVRDDQLKRVNQKFLAGSALADGLAREYTLNEIAIITRAGPARLLGLDAQGPPRRRAPTRTSRSTAAIPTSPKMFSTPRYVLKAGRARSWRKATCGARPPAAGCAWRRDTTTRSLAGVRRHFEAYSSVSFDNYPCGRCPGSRWRSEGRVNIRGVFIEDTFAEAFTMRVARLIITGRNHRWARRARRP